MKHGSCIGLLTPLLVGFHKGIYVFNTWQPALSLKLLGDSKWVWFALIVGHGKICISAFILIVHTCWSRPYATKCCFNGHMIELFQLFQISCCKVSNVECFFLIFRCFRCLFMLEPCRLIRYWIFDILTSVWLCLLKLLNWVYNHYELFVFT